MPTNKVGLLRRLAPVVFVLALVSTLFVVAQLPEASAADKAALASGYRFVELPIALPPNLPQRTVRTVNPEYEHIKSWISSVGAAVALNDLDGGNKPDDLCLVDARSDAAIITPAPGTGGTYAPFVLDAAPLPYDDTMAPMGCAPGDFNLDGWTDVLVYYWGRTPVLFLHKPASSVLSRDSYVATELMPGGTFRDSAYHGPLWNTNAVAIADFDGDGKPDIGVFNYFPDTGVLDPHGNKNVMMNHSMSRAQNAGGAHVLRWKAATPSKDGEPATVVFDEQRGAIDPRYATGWTLASSSADLDGDLLPELYLANDFGNDRFFHNVSTPGNIKFALAKGYHGPFTPKSMVLGNDSFKGMGIEFGDLHGTGRFDAFVSNITHSWGIEESNFVWRNTSVGADDAKDQLSRGVAPFENEASSTNMAWVGWGWDAKMADFDNSGNLAVVQTAGFVKGSVNRWNWLQELAMANDLMLQEPAMWPKAGPGDDIAGSDHMAFWAPEGNGRYTDLSPQLGMDTAIPSRGVAVADANADGSQDFAVARQWGPPAYYRNGRVGDGDFVGLRLHRPVVEATGDRSLRTPAYGALVKITTADGRSQLAQLDGGGGHSGKRSFDIYFGLGSQGSAPVSAEISWRDLSGAVHKQTVSLTAGWHDYLLTTQAQEVTAK